MTGLRENPFLVALTGRYDHIRSRLRQRRINYDVARVEQIDAAVLPDLRRVADNYRFYSTPDRTSENLGEDRSTCLRVNSMSASVLAAKYDDFFGRGARREQIFVFSISTPTCSIINFKLGWYDRCVHDLFSGNATACQLYILKNFDALHANEEIHAGVPVDFGERGTPFLKCKRRPSTEFAYLTDLLVPTSYWAGGSYHVEIQTSRCWAAPLVRSPDSPYSLFQTVSADESANVVVAVEPVSSFAYVVAVLYGITSVALILRGLCVAILDNNLIAYVPSRFRRRLFGTWQLPSMALTAQFMVPQTSTMSMVLCRGEHLMASDLWMNHWLYITLSILDSLCNLRTTYVTLNMGSWMLTKKADMANFLFVCSAITKLTWTMCFVHTVFRFAAQLVLRVLLSSRRLRAFRVVHFAYWYVDSVALFMSYKLYALFVCAYFLTIYAVKKTTTVMVRQTPYKVPVYGAFPDLANFWGNEIICDLVVLCGTLLVAAHVLASLLLLTRYRRVTFNRVLRLLQDRFFFVGWDAMVVMEALGIDPLDESRVNSDFVAATHCTLGALIQQLYTSGPSGFVELIGDRALLRDHQDDDDVAPCVVKYPPEIAQQMGLCRCDRLDRMTAIELWRLTKPTTVKHFAPPKPRVQREHSTAIPTLRSVEAPAHGPTVAQRQLHLHAEWRWGRILCVDYVTGPRQLTKKADGRTVEFAVHDVLEELCRDTVHPLMSEARTLRIS